ncbi:MAG: hypothetical protein LBR35_02455 [Rickettsiales bacterium]|jgi:hypothetical protein|nr:hypothetical protein [Rickettsiales bacterium]
MIQKKEKNIAGINCPDFDYLQKLQKISAIEKEAEKRKKEEKKEMWARIYSGKK